MPSLDSLPGDQRAVLQLVLGRGRSYDEIARLLSINPDGVRERALAALDALGPQTAVPTEQRALITDYLLGQLPEDQLDGVRDRLAESPGERAWARVVSSELAGVAADPLPEIPVETASARASHAPAPGPALRGPAATTEPDEPADHAPADAASAAEALGWPSPRRGRRRRRSTTESPMADTPAPPAPAKAAPGPRSSRVGGLVVIIAAVVVVAVILFLILRGGSSPHPTASTPATSSSTSSTAAVSTTSSTTSANSTSAKVVAQINLTPVKAGSKTAGIADILREGATDGIAIVAQNVAPNTTRPANAYAVWLYNSATDAHILGFVNPGVGKTGRLSTAGALPANAARYKQLIVTIETSASPKTPGPIILRGTLTGL